MTRAEFSLVPFTKGREPNALDTVHISIDGWLSLAQGVCEVEYTLRAAQDRIQWPAFSGNSRQDQLWRHTCMELFVRPARSANYWEFNFAPTGAWNVYRFSSYRENMQAENRIRQLSVQPGAVRSGQHSLSVTIPLVALFPDADTLYCGISAVVERNNGDLQYFALTHPEDKPDFHQMQSFVVELAF